MGSIPVFEEGHIESLSKVLGECGSGTDISRFLDMCGIEDTSGESTKWRRLNTTFVNLQRKHRCANFIVDFVSKFFSPVRFVGRNEQFEALRSDLNLVLAFAGLEYGADGKFRNRTAVSTITEAEARLKTLRAKFQGRLIHIEVLKYCRVELLQDNYFHAVFEASKGLAQRIREMSGVDGDGTALIDRVFSIERPVLAFNTLQTETEKSEHKGMAALLKGCFSAVRNPLAHEPKILWEGEEDAADYLSLISLLHRRLDSSVKTGLGATS